MQQDELNNLIILLKLIGGKFIIVEDGRPKTVIMSYDEFQELAAPFYAGKLAGRAAGAEIVNKKITSAQIQDLNDSLMEEVVQTQRMDSENDIRIEPIEPLAR